MQAPVLKSFSLPSTGGCGFSMGPIGQPGKVIVPEFPFMQPTIIMPNAPWEPMRILPPIPPPAPIAPVIYPQMTPVVGVAPAMVPPAITPCGGMGMGMGMPGIPPM